MKYILLILFAFSLLASCKKEANQPTKQFTLKGRMYMSYPSKPLANQQITFSVTSGHLSTYRSDALGSAKTDDSGFFSITYTELDNSKLDFSNGEPIGHLFSQYLQIDNVPYNQNVDKNFFIPTSGKIEIYLQTNSPLENNKDTLFLGHFAGSLLVIDTITNTTTGLFRSGKVPVGVYTMEYGRGWKDFHYNAKINGFSQGAHSVDCVIHGDPTIDKMTINY